MVGDRKNIIARLFRDIYYRLFIDDAVGTPSSGMSLKRSLFYALLLSALYLSFEWIFSDGLFDNSTTEKALQAAGSFGQTFFNRSDLDEEPVTVMFFSEEATKVSNMGWPLKFAFIQNAFESVLESGGIGPRSVFLDISIRTADHDREGFCGFLDYLADYSGTNVKEIEVKPDLTLIEYIKNSYGDSWHSDCLNIELMVESILFETLEEKKKLELKGDPIKKDKKYCEDKRFLFLDQFADLCTADKEDQGTVPIYFGASLEFLNAKHCYQQYRKGESCLIDESIVERYRNDVRKGANWQTNYYIDLIREWPALALLDLYVDLVPIQVLADQGKGMHIFVGENNIQSPAYRMVCDQDENKQKLTACSGDYLQDNRSISWKHNNLYLSWLLRNDPRLVASSRADNEYVKSDIVNAGNESEVDFANRYWNRPPEQYWNQSSICKPSSYGSLYRNLIVKDKEPPTHGELSFDICPPFLQIDFQSLLTGAIDYELMSNAVADSHVIIAVNIKRFDDVVESPLHGSLLGAFSHATAIENLSNNKLLKTVNTSFDQSVSFSKGIILILVKYVLVFMVIALLLYNPTPLERFVEKVKSASLPLGFLLALALVIGSVMMYLSGWIGYERVFDGILSTVLILGVTYLLIASIVGNFSLTGLSRFQPLVDAAWGLGILASHIMIIAALMVLFFLGAAGWVYFSDSSPPAVLESFYGILPFYLMVAREDMAKSFALIMGEEKIAEILMD